ncbi:hypothetical protein HDU93_007010, partial [Gonapodya sp. JEL0774]
VAASENGYTPEQAASITYRHQVLLSMLYKKNPSMEVLQVLVFVTLAFAMLLRADEVLAFRMKDIDCKPGDNAFYIKLKQRKNIKTGKPATEFRLNYGIKPEDFCPHLILSRYLYELEELGIEEGPLFPRINWNHVEKGSEAAYDEMLAKLRDALSAIGVTNVKDFGTHSMHQGGVKFLLSLGVPPTEVAEIGTWKINSPAFMRYVTEWCNKGKRKAGGALCELVL